LHLRVSDGKYIGSIFRCAPTSKLTNLCLSSQLLKDTCDICCMTGCHAWKNALGWGALVAMQSVFSQMIRSVPESRYRIHQRKCIMQIGDCAI
jgi:hypothetical protein